MSIRNLAVCCAWWCHHVIFFPFMVFAINISNLLITTKWDQTNNKKKLISNGSPLYLYGRNAKVGRWCQEIDAHSLRMARKNDEGQRARSDRGRKTKNELLIVFVKFISWIRNYLFGGALSLYRFACVFLFFTFRLVSLLLLFIISIQCEILNALSHRVVWEGRKMRLNKNYSFAWEKPTHNLFTNQKFIVINCCTPHQLPMHRIASNRKKSRNAWIWIRSVYSMMIFLNIFRKFFVRMQPCSSWTTD